MARSHGSACGLIAAVLAFPMFGTGGALCPTAWAGGPVCPDATITVTILTDSYPEDTSWQIAEQGGDVIEAHGPLAAMFTLHTWDVCVPSDGCFDFTIFDVYADGLETPGYYTVSYNGEVVATGGAFANMDVVYGIGSCGDPCGNGTCDPGETHESCPQDCPYCDYCEACFSETSNDWITRVRFNTIDHTSGQDGTCSYGDYTSVSTTVVPDYTYTLRVSFFSQGQWTEHVRAWIDWDGDCSFQSDESYYLGEGVDATLTRSITVPSDAERGCTRMRVIENFNTDLPEPCPNLFYGEAEDYTICIADNLTGACCLPITPWCDQVFSEAECLSAGGTFQGLGTMCDAPDCNGNGVSDLCDTIGPGDYNANGEVDLVDLSHLVAGMDGPATPSSYPQPGCYDAYMSAYDFDSDDDIDLDDLAEFMNRFGL